MTRNEYGSRLYGNLSLPWDASHTLFCVTFANHSTLTLIVNSVVIDFNCILNWGHDGECALCAHAWTCRWVLMLPSDAYSRAWGIQNPRTTSLETFPNSDISAGNTHNIPYGFPWVCGTLFRIFNQVQMKRKPPLSTCSMISSF